MRTVRVKARLEELDRTRAQIYGAFLDGDWRAMAAYSQHAMNLAQSLQRTARTVMAHPSE